MNQKHILALILFGVLGVFGGFVGYDIYKNDRLGGVLGHGSNWQWSNNWTNHNVSPAPAPTPIAPNEQPVAPQTQIMAADYATALSKSGELGMPVLVFFEADWCSWCKKMKADTMTKPEVVVLLRNYIVVFLDSDKNREVVRKFGVSTIPAYAITNFKEENLKFDSGYKDGAKFSEWLNNPSMYKQPKNTNPEVTPPPEKKPDPDKRRPRYPRDRDPGCPPK